MNRVAFQGERGAYSEEAIRRVFGGAAEPVPCRTFAEVGAAVEEDRAAYGVLPVENTLVGTVTPGYDVLAAGRLRVVGEAVVAVHHCVLGLPGTSLESVARVLSHPVALAQCTRFFASRPRVEAVAAHDTAGAARQVAEAGDPAAAALASRVAAERYGLVVLQADVEDRPDNQTRFLVAARPDHPAPRPAAEAGAVKSLLRVDVENRPGALLSVLAPLAERGINLAKLEARPGEAPWTYRFFIEVDADAREAPCAAALERMEAAAAEVRVLGCFASASPPAAPAPV